MSKKLGGKAADRQMSSGGGFEPGPGQSAMQYIPEFPAMLEGVFMANPDTFWGFKELFDPNGPDFLRSRPVEDDFEVSGDQKLSDKLVAPFYLVNYVKNASQPGTNREVKKLVPLKLVKSLYSDLLAQFEMTGGQPLSNQLMRVSKSGKGINTKYSFVVVGANPLPTETQQAVSALKLRDGRQVGQQVSIEDWLADIVEMDYDNLNPGDPRNVEAAAARANKTAKPAQPGTQSYVPTSTAPAIDLPDEDAGKGAPPTQAELLALPLKDLRDLAIEHQVVPAQPDPAQFKANRANIAAQLAAVLLQKAA